jgi:hypothetical protein
MDRNNPKEIKKSLLEKLKNAGERERDTIKIAWGRRIKPYGIKIYKENILMTFD